MNYLKKFNEAIVDYKNEAVDGLMGEINTYPRHHRFQISELTSLGAEYNIEIVDYNTFLNDLPERDKATAPPNNTANRSNEITANKIGVRRTK